MVHQSLNDLADATCVYGMQSMDVSKFWDLMINALKAANAVSPLNKN